LPAPSKPPRREKKAPRPIARSSTPIKRGKRPSKVRKTPRGKLKKLADKLWSLIVRAAGKCRICGKESQLQAAHGFSRRYAGTRWDLRNGWALCAGHHVFYTHRPLEWDSWLRAELGDLYEPMRAQALTQTTPDYDAIISGLKPHLEGGAL
jgi:hypothetical protein